MDIVIYMNAEDFAHKTSRVGEYYWSMGRVPKNFTENDKIYIACQGEVQGWVECLEFNPDDLGGETLVWDSSTWMQFIYEEVMCKPFRGFRYRWWDKPEPEGGGER